MGAVSASRKGGAAARPLIAHVIFRLDYGGLENGLVNLINRMADDRFRHAVIALTEATDFRGRLKSPEVAVHTIGKQAGKDPGAYVRLFRLLRELRPSILHTRNIGTLDCAPLGRVAGVPVCIHGEHGWDTHDPEGRNPRYRRLRRLANPFVRRFITVSDELYRWLTGEVGINPDKAIRICNGVDVDRFSPGNTGVGHPEMRSRFGEDAVIVGSVLRFNEIKDPLNLVEAFVRAHEQVAAQGVELCLAMIGDGPLRAAALARLEDSGAAAAAWLPGSRDDVAELLRSMDIFTLPSRREGISNTLLEAMASGLPLIATDTGGNPELVQDELNGMKVPPGDPASLAAALARLATDRKLREGLSIGARQRAVDEFSIGNMVDGYRRVYEDALAGRKG